MDYYLSLDGGGSKLAAILFDEELRLVAHAQSGGINRNFIPPETIARHLHECLDQLFTAGPVPITRIYGACSGADLEALFADINPPIPALTDAELVTLSEGQLGLLAAELYPDGVVALAGTGSDIFYIRDGETVCVLGGLGALLGDEGSGSSIGREALRTAYFAEFRGESCPLLEEIRAAAGRTAMWEIIMDMYRSPAPVARMASYSRQVGLAAHRGDPAARGILEKAGVDLARQVAMLFDRYALPPDTPVCVTGSAYKSHPVLFETLRHEAQALCGCRVRAPLFEPVVGGVLCHAVHNQGGLTPVLLDRMRRDYAAYRYTIAPEERTVVSC